jgi:purine-binding chemotaxis protein CheW
MSDSENGDFDSQEGLALRRGVLPPLLGVQDITDISEFFVSKEEQRQSLASYLSDPAFSSAAVMPDSIVEFLSFWVGDEEYAVDILEIGEIIKVPEITEVPRAPQWLLGVISLRGTVVPILDLRIVLKLEPQEISRSSRVLVLRADGEPVGILVDRVTSVVRLERSDIEAKPQTMKLEAGDVIRGVGRIGERILIILDGDSVVSVLERT